VSCGLIQSDDEQSLKVLAKGKGDRIAEYGPRSARRYLRVVLGESDPKHVHIDVTRNRAADVGQNVPPNSSVDEIRGYLDQLIGTEIASVVSGEFVLPAVELPEEGLIRSLKFQTPGDDFAITTIGGEFEIRGQWLYYIAWRLTDGKKNVMVRVQTQVATRFHNEFLVRQLGLVNTAFRVFVLGERPAHGSA